MCTKYNNENQRPHYSNQQLTQSTTTKPIRHYPHGKHNQEIGRMRKETLSDSLQSLL